MVGRFIASISNFGSIFTSALCASVNMVGYISYGSPYRTMRTADMYVRMRMRTMGKGTYGHSTNTGVQIYSTGINICC